MKKVLIVIITIVLIAQTGCKGFNTKEINTEEVSVSEQVRDIIALVNSNNYESAFEVNTLDTFINSQDKSTQEFYKLMINSFQFVSYDENGELVLKCPAIESLIDIAMSDTNGFVKDYENFMSIELDDSDIKEYLVEYYTNVLRSGNYQTESVSFTVELTDGKKLSIKNNLFLNTYLDSYKTKLIDTTIENTNNLKTNNVKVFDYNKLEKIEQNKNYVMTCQKTLKGDDSNGDDNAPQILNQKYILKITNILHDDGAFTKIKELSANNSSMVLPDNTHLIYVEYEVKNISELDLNLGDIFRLVTDDYKHFYEFSGFRISGILNNTVIAPDETKTMSTVLIGGTEKLVYWNDQTHLMLNVE